MLPAPLASSATAAGARSQTAGTLFVINDIRRSGERKREHVPAREQMNEEHTTVHALPLFPTFSHILNFAGRSESPSRGKAETPERPKAPKALVRQSTVLYTIGMGLWERFWSKVTEDGNGCWVWQDALDHGGYGHIYYNRRKLRAHRVSYRWWVGPIASWLQLDHLCRNRACVNPAHLEAVTQDVNVGRGYKVQRTPSDWRPKDGATHCPNDHPWTPKNTIIRRWEQYPKRRCRTCQLERVRDWYRRQRASV